MRRQNALDVTFKGEGFRMDVFKRRGNGWELVVAYFPSSVIVDESIEGSKGYFSRPYLRKLSADGGLIQSSCPLGLYTTM